MNRNRKGVVAYLLIAFGLAWAGVEAMYRSKGLPLRAGGVVVSAFAPAVACFVVRKWVTREGFADAGLRLHLRKWPYYLLAWLLPIAVVACIVILSPIFGASTADFSLDRGFRYLASVGKPVPSWAPHSLLPLLCIWLIQAIVTVPIFFGEEFGWRGYLQKRLFPESPALSAVITGLIWGAWHLPANLRGYNFPDDPILGSLVVFPVSCIFMSIIFGWLVQTTGSIWSSSLAHAATNNIGGDLVLILFGGGANFLYVGYVGLLGWIPLGALSAWIVFTGQLKPAAEALHEMAQRAQAG